MSTIPIRVADAAPMMDGEMTEVDAGGTPVLLARVGGRLHACAARCPHAGAPLARGVDGTEASAAMAAFASELETLAARLPAYSDYLEKIARAPSASVPR